MKIENYVIFGGVYVILGLVLSMLGFLQTEVEAFPTIGGTLLIILGMVMITYAIVKSTKL